MLYRPFSHTQDPLSRRDNTGPSKRVNDEENAHRSSRRQNRTGEQRVINQEKHSRSSWIPFSGRTEPLTLLTTVKKSDRHTSSSSSSSYYSRSTRQSQRSNTRQHAPLPKSTANAASNPPNNSTKAPGLLTVSKEIKTRQKSQRSQQRPTVSLLSFFTGAGRVIPEKPIPKVTCISCLSDDIPTTKAAQLACSHNMCYSCLRRLFNLSLTDPQQHMPPRCCTQDHIPSRYIKYLFDEKFQRRWMLKYREYTTKNRFYCPAQGCGRWIKPRYIVKDHAGKALYGRCPRCRTTVCCLCRAEWHGSRGECPKDESVQKLEDLARENGWQRCYNCSSIVELKDGCNHMTCRCKAEFCMRCAKKWKTCQCPWFNYREADNTEWLDDNDNDDDAVNRDYRQYQEEYVEPGAIYIERELFARQYILARRAAGVYNDLRVREEPDEAYPWRLDVLFARG